MIGDHHIVICECLSEKFHIGVETGAGLAWAAGNQPYLALMVSARREFPDEKVDGLILQIAVINCGCNTQAVGQIRVQFLVVTGDETGFRDSFVRSCASSQGHGRQYGGKKCREIFHDQLSA